MATLDLTYESGPAQVAYDAGYIGEPYTENGCWDFVRNLYRDGLGINIPEDQNQAATDLVEVWFDEPGAPELDEVLEPWDIIIYKVNRRTVQHVGICASKTHILHTRQRLGTSLDNLEAWKPYTLQVVRHISKVDFRDVSRATPQEPQEKVPLFGVRTLVSPVRSRGGQLRFYYHKWIEGRPLTDYFDHGNDCVAVFRDSIQIPEEQWKSCVPQPGEDWIIVPRAGAAPVWIVVAQIAIAVALTVASHYLFRPGDPRTEREDPSFSIGGIQSTRGPGRPVTVIYGRRRVGIQYLQASVRPARTFIDDGQPAQATTITAVTGGLQSHDEEFGAAVQVTAPGHSLSVGNSITIQGVQGPTQLNRQWRVAQIFGDDIELFGSNNLFGRQMTPYVANSGSIVVNGVRTVTASDNSSSYAILGSVGQGPIEEIEVNTIEINGQPISNFPGAQIDATTALGEPLQPVITGFTDVRTTVQNGTELSDETNGHIFTTASQVEGFGLNLEWRSGFHTLSSSGDVLFNRVNITYEFRVNSPQGAWQGTNTIEVRGNKLGVLHLGIERTNLTLDTYDIRVRVHDPHNDDSVRAKYIPHLSGITHITANTENYPNWALLALNGVASEDIQGSFPNVTVVVKGRKVRVGSFGAAEVYNDNPAWCRMDYMTNGRYGENKPDTSIDLAAFQAWADFNDETVDSERRHVMSLAIDQRTTEQNINELMVQSSRTEMPLINGKFSPRVTRNDVPAHHFNWAAINNLNLQAIRDVSGINVIQTRFQNEDEGFDEEILEYPAPIDQVQPIYPETIDLQGVSRASEVDRYNQQTLKLFQLPTFAANFRLPPQGILVEPHSILAISHDIPRWGQGGRVMVDASNSNTQFMADQDVEIEAGKTYHVYVTYPNMDYEAREVQLTIGTHRTIAINPGTPFSQIPNSQTCLWTIGESSPVDTAVRLLRVTDRKIVDDTWVEITGISHNPNVFTSAPPSALPPISTAPNANGPPPPIIDAVALERIATLPDGRRQFFVALSWDIGTGPEFAPYGGAEILRREVINSSTMGSSNLGEIELGEIATAEELAAAGFVRIGSVSNAFSFDDTTAIVGLTYVYRIVPLSSRGVPNNVGFFDLVVHVTGSTGSANRPGPPRDLTLFVLNESGTFVEVDLAEDDLFDQGEIEFIGEDVQFRWSVPLGFEAQSEVSFISQYRIEIKTADGAVLLHEKTITDRQFEYPLALNTSDSLRQGLPQASRHIRFRVWAITNTGLMSDEPASLTILNRAVDMSSFSPDVVPLISSAFVDWKQFNAPEDIASYQIILETDPNPTDVFATVNGTDTQIAISDLDPAQTYFVRICPADPFGPSPATNWTPAISFQPNGLGINLDEGPPPTPGGLTLSNGVEEQADGTQLSFVDASWNAVTDPEGSAVTYQVEYQYNASQQQIFTQGGVPENSFRIIPVPGNTSIGVRVLAVDSFGNASPYGPQGTIQSAADTFAPGLVTNFMARGFLKTIILTYAPPSDADLDHVEIHASKTNDRATAFLSGRSSGQTSEFTFNQDGLGAELPNNDTWFFWARALDRSGNIGNWTPDNPLAGVTATTVEVVDAVVPEIQTVTVFPPNPTPDMLVYKLPEETIFRWDVPSQQWVAATAIADNITSTQITDDAIITRHIAATQVIGSHILANTITGGHIAAGSVNADRLQANSITANELATSTLITQAAQIANALINNAHISDLSADKITAGNLNVNVGIGVGGNLFLQGAGQDRIFVVDNQGTPQVRMILGNLGAGATEWGAQFFSATGQIMIDIDGGGVTAAGIQVGAVEAQHIAAAQIDATHLITNGLVVTTAAQLANAIIGTAQIQDLAVDRLRIADGAVTTFLSVVGSNSTINVPFGETGEVLGVNIPALDTNDILEIRASGNVSLNWPSSTTALIEGRLKLDSVQVESDPHEFFIGENGFMRESAFLEYFEVVTSPEPARRAGLFFFNSSGSVTAQYRRPRLSVRVSSK